VTVWRRSEKESQWIDFYRDDHGQIHTSFFIGYDFCLSFLYTDNNARVSWSASGGRTVLISLLTREV
jgi:hypothetical protein